LARILTTLIWTLWVMYVFVILIGISYNRDWKLVSAALAGSALLCVAMLLLRRGRLSASSVLVVLGTLATVTVIATVGQGVRDLALVGFPIIFVFAALTLNRTLFKLCVGLVLAAVCWLVLGENYGWFVPVPFVGEMANWIYLAVTVIILLVAALAVDLLATNMRQNLDLAYQEITQRKHAEIRNRIINEVQDFLLNPCDLNDIYRLVSQKVKELIGDGITATSILDEKNNTLRMGSYHGMDIPFEKVLTALGFDPWHKEFPLDGMPEEDLSIYNNKKLGVLEVGLYALMTRLVPESACLTIEKLLRVQKIYGMGFVHKDAHLGGLIILARSDITPFTADIEQIVNLATIAIERKRAEEEVQNSAKRFHALIEHGRDNISLLTADGTLLWESPSIDPVLGYTANRFVGENFFKLIHPDDQMWTSNWFAQVVQSPGSIQEGEFRLLHTDGAWRWIEGSAANLLEEQAVQAIVLNYRDITERKRLEKSIKQSESKYRKIVETANEGVIVLDKETQITLINPQMAAMLGYNMEELLGRKIESLMFEDDLSDHQTQMQVRARGQNAVYERCFRRKNGSKLWTLISATATTNAENVYDGAFGMITDITARKEAEDALRENAIRYRTLLDNLPQLVWQRDLDSVFVDGNAACARLLGTTVEALAGKTDYDFYPIELAEKYRADDRRIIENGRGETFEERFLDKNIERIARTTKVPLRDDQGKIYGTLGIAEDITVSKRAHEALIESEARFREVLENSLDASYKRNLKTNNYDYLSPVFSRIFGYTPDEFLNLPLEIVLELIHPDDRANGDSVITASMAGAHGTAYQWDYRFKHKDGQYRWLRDRFVMMRDEQGQPAAWIGSVSDITERKRAEEKFTKAFQASPTIVVISRLSDGCLVDVNESFEQIIGYTRSEAIEHNVFELGLWVNVAERQHLLPLLLANGKVRNEEVHFLTKRGEEIICLYSAELIELNGEKCALAVIEDITLRVQVEAKIRAALKEKETLLREVHHRVKNNLQVIISLIKMRARSIQEAATIQFLEELEGQAYTMALVYEQLYQSENIAEVNMAQYLRQLTANVLDMYKRRDAIQFHLDAPIALDVAQAMPCGLIVNELFSNILKYAFPSGFTEQPVVSITLRQEGETYHLTVSDNGRGFPPGFDWRSGQTMGLRLVNLWVTHQLGGTLAVSGKTGTKFAIAFDVKD